MMAKLIELRVTVTATVNVPTVIVHYTIKHQGHVVVVVVYVE
jgi:hypothetical protein